MDGVAALLGFRGTADFPLAVECDDIDTLVHLAMRTDVLALIPVAIGDAHPEALRRMPADNAQAPFADVHAIWLKGRTLSPSAQRAIGLAQQLGTGVSAPAAGSTG